MRALQPPLPGPGPGPPGTPGTPGTGLLVPLGPELQACPRELLRQRRGHDGQPQYLVRWSLVRSEERAAGGGSSAGPDAGSVSLWMSAEEVCASCPALLGEGKPAGPRAEEERAAGPSPAGGAAPDEASLREMEADVGSLVRRAGRQLGGTGAPEAASVLNTMHVLSAYAGIGSLAGAFRETGALDLLAKMLCHKEKQICRSAGKMLRALASHDAGSWAYVLLSLSQQDGVEQHMDFDSRYTLLELFAETTSAEEHCMSFEGIHLPQIPGKQLFTLVKRYLRVTSLLDELGSGEEQGGEQPESSRVKQEFEFSMAMAGLIVELLRAMGWEHSHEPEPPARQEAKPRTARSIFQHGAASCTAAQAAPAPPPKEPSAFKTRSAFPSRSSYVEYVRAHLVRGMRVRLLEDYEQVSAGDEGEFRQSNDGTPPVQVYWQALGCTYWVHWHMVEIIGSSGQEEQEGRQRGTTLTNSQKLAAVAQPFFSKPLGGLYSLPYLGEQPSKAAETLSRAEWWELLFFVKQLEAQEQEEIAGLVQREQAEQLPGPDEEALIRLPVPVGLARKVLRVLEERSRGSARGRLRGSRVYGKCWPGRGAERDGGGSPAASSEGAGCGSAGPGAAPAEAAKDEDGVCAVLESDARLFGELLEREGLRFPEAAESRACGSCEGASSRGSLEEVAQVAEAIRSSGCEAELRVAGLRHMVRVLQEEPEPERQEGGEARGGPGTRGSSGVRNGLLVLKMLVDGHRGLAEQLVSGELPALLQSCWRDGQGAGGPTALLALGVINCLAEHRLPLGPETPGAEALLEAREPAGSPGDGALSEDVVVALERQLCGGGPVPSGEASPRPQERRCFQMLLRSLELLGAEKTVGLRILRILNKFLDGYREDALPWHECVEPCLSSLSTHGSDREVVQEVVGFLHRLAAASKDCAVAMCRAGAREALAKALEKHSSAVPTAPALLELLRDCEKFAGLHRTLTGSILAGCIQLVLGQIEEHRRSQRPISIPFFDVFLRNLCRGSSVEVKEDKCWEKVQVSSNPHRASKLTDRNPKTYWESNGSTGSHFITVHMQCGVVVREMSMLVASEDSSYMPARVVVLGGDSPAAIGTVLNAVTVLPSASRVVLLKNMTRFWPVIQIRVKRCQQGGIDTRVRGIEVLGPKPTFWPVFREQLCRRTFLCCTARALAWCQEIRRDRGRLLQLFGKLNRALRHEQDFAERFLPDDEAARALGRTCWEALVSPLVQSITSPDPSGVSPLAWLLSEYLGRGEPPQRPPARGAAFGSCVRLLTQLLVHVDPGGVELEEARAAGGQEGRNKEAPPRAAAAAQKPSGLWGIAQCWRGVVQQQVQRFLEAAGQAPDAVERYCGLYRRLRGATEELFGQQAAFVVALGQGFAGALLQLSFLTALHVSPGNAAPAPGPSGRPGALEGARAQPRARSSVRGRARGPHPLPGAPGASPRSLRGCCPVPVLCPPREPPAHPAPSPAGERAVCPLPRREDAGAPRGRGQHGAAAADPGALRRLQRPGVRPHLRALLPAVPGGPAPGAGPLVAGRGRPGADRAVLPPPLPPGDAERLGRVGGAPAAVSPLPAAGAGQAAAGAGRGPGGPRGRGAGGGLGGGRSGGDGAGPVPALLARVPAVPHGRAREVFLGGAELPAGRLRRLLRAEPEPAGLGVHEAPAAAVDVAGPRRAAVRRLRPARVHAADVRPAALQRRRGGGRGVPAAGHGAPCRAAAAGAGTADRGRGRPGAELRAGGGTCGQRGLRAAPWRGRGTSSAASSPASSRRRSSCTSTTWCSG
ncbi:cullin-9-like isoform X3 [Cygnus olor]|uniref:cullin-9-like isoform X3 n=1 Tax=Cygnus olor TaxID=8869 RepID=UPI001ADE94E9|nr:cullin-9-like isoform X3 [Cygnus olor]